MAKDRKKGKARDLDDSGVTDGAVDEAAEATGLGDWEPEAVWEDADAGTDAFDAPEEVIQAKPLSTDSADQGDRMFMEMQEQTETLRKQLARVTGEFEHFRRRTQEEKEKLILYANEALVMELLPIVDDFTRAVRHIDAAVDPTEIYDGIRLILGRLVKAMEKRGVHAFDSLGDRFDPLRHEAVRTFAQEGADPGTVLEEYERGYSYFDKLLRPARVVISPLNAGSKGRKGGKRPEETGRDAPPPLPADTVAGRPVEEYILGPEEIEAMGMGMEELTSPEVELPTDLTPEKQDD